MSCKTPLSRRFAILAPFAEGEQAFGAWLETVADHRLQDALRRVRRKKRGGDYQRVADRGSQAGSQWLPLVELLGGDIGTPSQNAAQQEAVLAVQVGVSALPADQREAIRMHCMDRLSLEETAEAMHCTARRGSRIGAAGQDRPG